MTRGENETWKEKKWQENPQNNVHQVKLMEKLQKAIMIVRMCRPLVLAAGKHHKSCGGLCLHWVDLCLASGSWLESLCPPLCGCTYGTRTSPEGVYHIFTCLTVGFFKISLFILEKRRTLKVSCGCYMCEYEAEGFYFVLQQLSCHKNMTISANTGERWGLRTGWSSCS